MKKVIVLAGPTGVGKTALSIELAKRYNGEIISGDAYQCYKELSIGSAKIKEEEKQGIPHYLVDYVSYNEEYNVKIFQKKAREYIEDIVHRGKTPIICGGTGLYIKALLYDYVFEEEKQDEEYLAKLSDMNNDDLYALLLQIDEKACEKIHKNNRQRVIRALMMAHDGTKKSERIEKQKHELLYNAYIIGLTMDRDVLYDRINRRVEMMMDEGLLNEISGIVKSEETFSLQSMQGIGYKEWLGYYKQEESIEEVIAKIQKNSRNFAKRQYTWFNNQLDVHWFDLTKQGKEEVFKEVDAFLGE